MKEEWRTIPDHVFYEVSNYGSVRSYKRAECKELTQFYDRKGYKYVIMDGKLRRVHRLVAIAFIPNPDNLPQVNHKDENKSNNIVSNLEWCTNQYNVNYGTSLERMARKQWVQVIRIDKDGSETTYDSILAAATENGVNPQSISQCCRRVQGRVSAGGYKWEYADNEKRRYYIERYVKKKKAVPVIATNKDGEDIYFSSIKEASEKISINRTNIIRCCTGKKHYNTAGGYKWRYANK